MRLSPFSVNCCGIIVAAIAATLCGDPAFAQNTPSDTPPQDTPSQDTQPQTDPVSAMIGAWEFSNADRDKICRFNFRTDATSGGYKLDIDKNCPNVFPTTKDIVGWAIDNFGNLRLLNTHGEAVIELTEVESGMYDGFRPDEGRYILQAAAAAPIRSADDMVGEWAIARGTGKPICALTLANTALGPDILALKVKPGCDALVTRFGPTSWRMDKGELVLLSARGQVWRFEENDANTWQRLPESADPVLMVRQ